MENAAATTCVVALGANLGDREAALARAAGALRDLGEIVSFSAVYASPALGPTQPDYLNAVVLVRTTKPAAAVLEALLSIERSLGRVRAERWGPRVIDLDLIASGDAIIDVPGLQVPHPEAAKRTFVLGPLVEVAPSLVLPGVGRVDALWTALPEADRAALVKTGFSLFPSVF